MALAAAMSCSMITGWANTAEIVGITVTNTVSNEVTTVEKDTVEGVEKFKDFNVTPEDLVTVTVKIKSENPVAALEDAEATFLTALSTAFGEGVTLSDDNIQYVDQQTTGVAEGAQEGTEATATFKFRPRMQTVNEVTSLKLIGPHVAKVGGTQVTTVQPFSYTVKNADIPLTLAVDNAKPEVGAPVTFTVSVPEGKTLPTSVTVKGIGDDYVATLTDGKFTWTAAVGTYSVSVSAGEGYSDSSVISIAVDEPVVEIPPVEVGKEDEAQDAINKIEVTTNPTGNEVTLNVEATAGGQKVRYNVDDSSEAITYDAATGAITYDQSRATNFAERVKVVTQVGTEEQAISKTSYIFFVPGDISFGNVFALSDAEGKDIFADNTIFKNNKNHPEMATARAAALAVALGKSGTDSVAKYTETLDRNDDNKVTLAEYYILKRMITADDSETLYVPSNVNKK